MRFHALIDGIHIDPKKGSVKITLIGSSHVSLDELTTLGPKDEPIQVTLKSEQTRLEYRSILGDEIVLDEEAAAKLKEAAERLKTINHMEADELAGKIVTEFPTPEEPEKDGEEG